VLATVGLGMLTLGFVRSGSRGGFIALVAVAAFVVVRFHEIPLRRRLAAALVVGLVLLGTASERYWDEMKAIVVGTDYNLTNETGRLAVWRRGVGYMLEHPILGVGPNNFGVAEGTLSPLADRQQYGIGVRWTAPHNSFIQAGAELGIPGLVLFLAVIASAFGVLQQRGRGAGAPAGSAPDDRPLRRALTASLVGFVVGAFFLTLAYSEMLYTLIALAIGLHKVSSGATRTC
jgi:putative inorganic carbon (HCO3(-)) transporter